MRSAFADVNLFPTGRRRVILTGNITGSFPYVSVEPPFGLVIVRSLKMGTIGVFVVNIFRFSVKHLTSPCSGINSNLRTKKTFHLKIMWKLIPNKRRRLLIIPVCLFCSAHSRYAHCINSQSIINLLFSLSLNPLKLRVPSFIKSSSSSSLNLFCFFLPSQLRLNPLPLAAKGSMYKPLLPLRAKI